MSVRRVLFVLLWRSAPYYGQTTWGASQTPAMGEPGAKLLSHGLSNSATFVVNMLLDAGIDAKLVHVASDNDIWKEIQAFDATDVILEAFWCRPKKLDDLHAVFPNVRFIVRGHSSTPFLAHDTYGFKWALEYLTKPNSVVAPNDPRFLTEVRFLARQMFPDWDREEVEHHVPYLPNYYPEHGQRTHPHRDAEYVDVGCFGAARPFKNLVGQAIAAMMFASAVGRKLRFHINGDRIECGGGPTVKNTEAVFAANPNAELVRHDWMPHAEFKALVGSMDLVTQISFAETFCIVAADAASQGVPLVTSKEVPWGARIYQADPTDVNDMANAMGRAYSFRFVEDAFDGNRAGLRHYCDRTQEIWLRYFGVD